MINPANRLRHAKRCKKQLVLLVSVPGSVPVPGTFYFFISEFMKKYLLKLALQVLKACCDWLSDYIGTLPSNVISNALKCAPFSDED